MKKILAILFSLMSSVYFTSCKKLVVVDGPTTSVNSKNIYNNDATAIGAITSLYAKMSSIGITSPGELPSLSCVAGLSADELTYYNPAGTATLAAYFKNTLTNSNVGGTDYWGVSYQRIYLVNAALEGISVSTELSDDVKQQVRGEALFMRAFYYFYLVNLYGDLPMVLTTDYKVNALLTKSPKSRIYEQILADLLIAKDLLSPNYLKGDAFSTYPIGVEERVRPTKWAATALLARTYLFLNDWLKAEKESSEIIGNSGLYEILPLEQVFLKNNREAIWQLQPIQNGYNTHDANAFILPVGGPSALNPVFISDFLINEFDDSDLRKTNWLSKVSKNGRNYYYANKYKIRSSSDPNITVTEYSTIFRLAEQFLIRSEAQVNLGNLDNAIRDLDVIRKRAGLPSVKTLPGVMDKEALLNLILKERQRELFSEWGHRWLDLKRTKSIDHIMGIVTVQKGNSAGWKSHFQNYPISLTELKANPNLTQVVGY